MYHGWVYRSLLATPAQASLAMRGRVFKLLQRSTSNRYPTGRSQPTIRPWAPRPESPRSLQRRTFMSALTEDAASTPNVTAELRELDISNIVPNEGNPRLD